MKAMAFQGETHLGTVITLLINLLPVMDLIIN